HLLELVRISECLFPCARGGHDRRLVAGWCPHRQADFAGAYLIAPTAHTGLNDRQVRKILPYPRVPRVRNSNRKETHKRRIFTMRNRLIFLVFLLFEIFFPTTLPAHSGSQTQKSPPIEQYFMPQAEEIALAQSAAPANISGRATIKVLTK